MCCGLKPDSSALQRAGGEIDDWKVSANRMNCLLKTKAGEFEAYAERLLIDPGGVVYSSIHDQTLKPWTSADLGAGDDFIEAPPFKAWEILNYENSGMTTGGYLAAQSFRWRVTGDPQALLRAGRSFTGICHIYDLGRQQEEGYFPKTYGGRLSHEISTDQYLYAIKGMMSYLPVAPAEHARAIGWMIPRMVDFWVRRGYRHDYFSLKDMLWPLGRFPSLLLAASVVSGESRYRQEADRLNREFCVYEQPVESQILVRARQGAPFSQVEQRLGNRYSGAWLAECSAMDIMELDECLQHSQNHTQDWLGSMALSWKEGKLSLTDHGLCRAWTLYDPLTGSADSPLPQWTGNADPLGWSFLQWLGGYLSPRSAMLARVGVHVGKWLPDEGAAQTVRQILSSLSLDQMRHCIDPDGKQMLDQHRFLCHQVCVDSIVNWLWAYWQGRHEGIIPHDA